MENQPKQGDSSFRANIERFTGFASVYDTCRPKPPSLLLDILMQLAKVELPELVVDIGCGTGLSTRVWSERAKQVIGTDPSIDMLDYAKNVATPNNVSYRLGLSNQIELPDSCADIVTCSQSLHWMEPETTLAAIHRLLRTGGVFAAYDYDWPPTTSDWEADAACLELTRRMSALGEKVNAYSDLKRWWKEEHLARMRDSGYFRFTKEILLHHTEMGNAERLYGLAHSLGELETLQKHGITDEEIELDEFRETAKRTLGDDPKPWYFSYRVRVGIV